MAEADPKKLAAPATPKSTKSGRTVIVGSKLPMSVDLQLCTPQISRSTGRWGTTEETIYVPSEKVFTIRGTSHPSGTAPKGFRKAPDMIEEAGYALTPGVDADFFEEWLRQNAETPLVQSHLIVGSPSYDDLEAEALDHKAIDSGLGPLDPEGDRRSPRPLNSSVQPVKTDDRRAA